MSGKERKKWLTKNYMIISGKKSGENDQSEENNGITKKEDTSQVSYGKMTLPPTPMAEPNTVSSKKECNSWNRKSQ